MLNVQADPQVPPGADPVGCFLAGTRIATPDGSVCVEDMQVGSLVLTPSGQSRSVRWIGHRGLDCSRYRNPSSVWPICIRAGAFADGKPERDLLVSPGHAILVDGVLIQASDLVNGTTILQMPRNGVEYWHVELDSHGILLAEGLPAESYIDNGNRSEFVDGGGSLEAFPTFESKRSKDTCVPLELDGPAVQRAKLMLLARAKALGNAITHDADVHVVVDGIRLSAQPLSETRFVFMLPPDRSTIELRCRTFAAAHIDPESNDQRSLGICVGRLQLDGEDVALDDETAFTLGWHEFERGPEGQPFRWTHGRTPLRAGVRLVVIDIASRGHYWAQSALAPIALTG